MKRIICLVISIAVVFATIMTLPLMSSAETVTKNANSVTFQLSPSNANRTYQVGQQITVTATIKAPEKLMGVQGEISYNRDVLQYVSGEGNTNDDGSKVVTTVELPLNSFSANVSYKIVLKAKATGSSNISVKLIGSNSDVKNLVRYTGAASSSITVNAATPTQKSTNANLSSLSVNIGAMSPRFSANTTSYSVTVPYATSKITLSAKVQDTKAKLTGTGTYNLNVGKNTKSVTVTAESGAKKTYTVNITRQTQEETFTGSTSSDEQPPVESNPDNPSDINPVSDPLLVTDVNGVARRIVPDASQMNIAAPIGFTSSSATLGSVSVNTFVESNGSNNYILYVTTDENGEDPTYYYYTENGYKRLAYMVANNNTYIVENPVLSSGVPDGYYKSTANINNATVTVFKFDEELMNDFCIMYCYLNGEYGYYRFDSYDTTIQRAPDFTIIKEAKTNSDDLAQEKSLLSDLIWRYKNMTVLGKIVVFGILICAILIIITVIVLIVKLFKDKSDDDDDGPFSSDIDYFDRDISSSEVTDDISDFAVGSIAFDNVADLKPKEEIKETNEEPEEQEESPEIPEQPPVAPVAAEETKPSDETPQTDDDDDDDFADEESLKNLRGF